MTPTKVKLDAEARKAIIRGVDAVYEPVRRTFGPEGSNALLYRTFNRGPRITNDGVTVAEVIEPSDEFENLVAKAFKEATKRTNEKVGDGTTGTTIIAGHLLHAVFAKLSENSTPIRTKISGAKIGVMSLKREILETAEKVKAEVTAMAKPVKDLKDLEKIAIVSVEDPELGKVVAKMAYEVGTEGFIDVVEGFKGEIETEVIKGMRFPAKTPAKAFVNNPARYEMVATDSPVIVTNYSLDNAAQVGAFTKNLNTSKLIIIAPSFSENVLVNMVAAVKNGFFIYPVAVPSMRTEQLEDLAIFCGAKFVNKDLNMKLEDIHQGAGANTDLGFMKRLIVKDTDAKEDAMALSDNGGKKVEERVKLLTEQAKEQKQEIHRKMVERRIASMSSAVGIIKVGGPSQAETLYQKLKIEDATYACKAALRGGYVPGGGLCLKAIADKMPENILTASLRAPYEQIQENSDGNLQISKEIIDPAEVVFYQVEHATSVVAHLATVNMLIPEEKEKSPAEGYEALAKALRFGVSLYGKHLGLLKESDDEAMRDMMQGYEEKQAQDS